MGTLQHGIEPSRQSNRRQPLLSGGATLEGILQRLKQAQKEAHVVLTIEGSPNIVEMCGTSPPESFWKGRKDMDRFMDEGIWQTDGPGFQQLREWVEVHWNTGDEKEAPNGTVATGDDWGLQRENQLDSVTATRKLIAASKLFGPEHVGNYATEFAAHGMIEVRWTYLLKGPPIEAAKPLDEYCKLLPYAEALRRIGEQTDPTDLRTEWPEPHSDNVCALEGRYFERASLLGKEYGQYTSPFLKDGPEQLALLLGLVWGCGFQILGNWRGVHPAAVAALPYRSATVGSGAGSRHVTLPLQGYGPPIQRRPLALKELREFVAKYSELPASGRTRLAKAMGNLRDSTERIQYKHKVFDVGVALSTLFSGDAEGDDLTALVPRKAVWYYSDSENERQETENMLSEFFAGYLRVVRGREFEEPGEEDFNRSARLLADAENVLRACLMSMIAEGQPNDWNEAMKRSEVRLDPPRAESEIPSVKADPLSWSVEEQGEIDRALEAVWRPIVEEAPLPPSHVGSTIASGVLSELAERYIEQGIPYVIPHPARLYMAHPKWPQTASRPLDERARYYCERDVGRHLRLWTDAASSKGLVQFPVPNDANMYHPQYRDDWPQPLLSSHEEDANARNPSPRTVTEKIAPSSASKQSGNTEHQLHDTAVKQEPTDPPQQLPESVQAGLRLEWQRVWTAFQHDVNTLTDSLLHMLDGIHAKHLAERQRLIEVMAASGGGFKTLEDSVLAAGDICLMPKYPKLRVFLDLKGEALFRRTAPGGSMEQTALKGWVTEVYSLWESRYRNQLKHAVRESRGSIRPRQEVLGDLGHIRNDLLHNGIAKRKDAARCDILRWFSEGERMQMRLRFVFDFLNQMSWLHQNSPVSITERGQASTWCMDREEELEEPAPALISVRPFVDPLEQDPRYRYGASVAFENGVFGTTPMGPENEETEAQVKERTQKWMKMTVNERGDLHVPDMGTVPAAELYRDYLKGEVRPGPGIPGPWVQFRE